MDYNECGKNDRGLRMTAEQLRTLRDAHPFVPFTIRMADGRTFRVHHRDYLSMSPTGRTMIVYRDDDSFSILDLLLTTELTVDAPSIQSNGSPPLEA
jgi:hypothetical protein